MPKPAIDFRAVNVTDLPRLAKWIATPEWQEWWGDVAEEIGYIENMLEGRDTTRPFIFQIDGIDAGYIQYWIIADQMFEPCISTAPWMKLLPDGAIGVDISVSKEIGFSKGVGSKVLAAFVKYLRAKGYDQIFIDPDHNNKRAIIAYEKAGFRAIPSLAGKTGDYVLMRHQEE